MEYSQPYPSSVPHAVLIPANIEMTRMFYGCSMVMECFFLGICCVLLIFSIYFRIGNFKLLIDQSGNKKLQRNKQNIICEVITKSNFMGRDNLSESDQSHKQNEEANTNSVEAQIMANTLRIYQRRFVYALSFTIPWVICINSFDTSIFAIIAASIFLGLVLMFNLRKTLPEWKISQLVYFLPAVASIFPFIGGNHSLYGWVPVLDPLSIEI